MSRNRPLVLGLPGTGNNLIAKLIGGAIHHYSNGLDKVNLDVPMIVPIRDRDLHWYRCTKQRSHGDSRQPGKIPNAASFSSPAELHYAHWWPTLNAIGGRTPLVVRYQDIIDDPDASRIQILDHCGIHDNRPWPSPVRDENEKWRL